MPKHPKILSLTATALASVVAFAFVAPGCSDEAAADKCYDYSTFKSDSKVVAFKADVLPILRRSCGLSAACHGSPTPVDPKQPFLGPSTLDPDPTQADIDKLLANIVDINAVQATSMKIVAKGSPQTSFLMHKMDGTLECADVKCDATCGVLMPQGSSSPLAEGDRDIVRLWIAQGAKND